MPRLGRQRDETSEHEGATEEWSPKAEFADPQNQQVEVQQESVVAEIMRQAENWDTDTLRNITSFDDALALVQETYGSVGDVSQELGDGFAVTNNDAKTRLVGLPLLLMSWQFYKGKYGDDFTAVRAIARHEGGGISKHIINDGSTGLREMLRSYQARTGLNGGLLARHGLRPSEYQFCETCQVADNKCEDPDNHQKDPKKGWKKATTYYIDTSA